MDDEMQKCKAIDLPASSNARPACYGRAGYIGLSRAQLMCTNFLCNVIKSNIPIFGLKTEDIAGHFLSEFVQPAIQKRCSNN